MQSNFNICCPWDPENLFLCGDITFLKIVYTFACTVHSMLELVFKFMYMDTFRVTGRQIMCLEGCLGEAKAKTVVRVHFISNIYKAFTKHLQTIHKAFTKHSLIIYKPFTFTKHLQIILKVFSKH
jgi:hypothetical protein